MKVPAQHVSVRLESEVVACIDALIPLFAVSWRDGQCSDVLREIIALGLDDRERQFEDALRELARRKKTQQEPE